MRCELITSKGGELFLRPSETNHHKITRIEQAIQRIEIFPITMQILTTQEERQLFTVTNTEQKMLEVMVLIFQQTQKLILTKLISTQMTIFEEEFLHFKDSV